MQIIHNEMKHQLCPFDKQFIAELNKENNLKAYKL
jgi:hypothetical protein